MNEQEKILNAISDRGQLTRVEYQYISNFLGDKNFLVFGTGRDTPYWRLCNKGGTTLFLENDPRWVIDAPDVYQIHYTTKRHEYKTLLDKFNQGDTSKLELQLPLVVTTKKWDVIFVDSPMGYNDSNPGRMQSIYTAYKLSHFDTVVFVHDCHRPVEELYVSTLFSDQKLIPNSKKLKIAKR